MKTYPLKTRELQEQGYLKTYLPELVAWGLKHSDEFRELINFDTRQAHADQQYEKRTNTPIDPDRLGLEVPAVPTWECVDSLELPDWQAIMADMLIEGHTHQEIAQRLGVHRVTVTGWVRNLKDKLRPQWRDGGKK